MESAEWLHARLGKNARMKTPYSDLPFVTVPSSRDDVLVEQCGALLNQSGENAPQW
jgi:hypothetical protein